MHIELNETDGKNGMIVAARIAREVLVVEKRMRGNQVVDRTEVAQRTKSPISSINSAILYCPDLA